MSIASEITRLTSAKAALKEAIEAKGVTVEASAKLDAFPALVESIPQGGGAADDELDDVIFIDLDGSLVAHYSKQDFLALTEMPANPTREGYVSQGWNYTLADAKAIVEQTGDLVIGQLYAYINPDNDTKIYVNIGANKDMKLNLHGNHSQAAYSVDWGDGSAVEHGSGVSFQEFFHTYENSGNYIISIASSSWALENYSSYNDTNICGTGSDLYYGSKITGVVIGPNFPTIYNFLCGCSNVEFVKICSSVNVGTSNYGRVFKGCGKLKYVNFPQGSIIKNSGFSERSGLETIIIPTEGDHVAMSFTYLFNLKFLSGVKANAITSCYKLKRLCNNYSSATVTGCVSLKRVTIPGNCSGSITQDSELRSIAGVETLNVAPNITNVPSFSYLLLKVADLSNTKITSAIFNYCNLLEEIRLPDTVTSINFARCQLLKSVNIPNSVRTFADYCFSRSQIKSIDLSGTAATSLNNRMFEYCHNLTDILLPNGVTTIPASCFFECLSLNEIVLPSGITEIKSGAFSDCNSLRKITVMAATPPTLASDAFMDFVEAIYVPAASVEDYKAATNWSNYASKIQAIPSA